MDLTNKTNIDKEDIEITMDNIIKKFKEQEV